MRGVFRGTTKVMDRCPHCGSKKPKELAESERKFNTSLYVIVGICTGGIGFLLYSLFYSRQMLAYCGECETTFAPNYTHL